jgi:hypothetical protein
MHRYYCGPCRADIHFGRLPREFKAQLGRSCLVALASFREGADARGFANGQTLPRVRLGADDDGHLDVTRGGRPSIWPGSPTVASTLSRRSFPGSIGQKSGEMLSNAPKKVFSSDKSSIGESKRAFLKRTEQSVPDKLNRPASRLFRAGKSLAPAKKSPLDRCIALFPGEKALFLRQKPPAGWSLLGGEPGSEQFTPREG